MRRVDCALTALMALQFLSATPMCASAWGNGGYSADPYDPDYGTHDWISDMALLIQTHDVTFLSSTYHSLFLLGTEAPDNPAYIGDTVNHHIYYYESGGVQDDVCAERAADMYASALAYLLAGDYDLAAYDIGVMAHYVSDPGVFGHTMGAYTDWGDEVHHSDYEDYVGSMVLSLPDPTWITLCDLDASASALGLAQKSTFGDGGDIMPNTWMDDNYDWSDQAFRDSAVASLHASVQAVAGTINHLLKEAFSSVEPPAPEEPGPPRSLSATLGDGHIVLSWSPPQSDGGAEVTEYVIFRSRDPAEPVSIDTVSGSTLTWTDGTVEKDTTYYYWVAASNSAGRGDLSTVVSATLSDDGDSWLLPAIILSTTSLILGSGAVLYWRRAKVR